MNQKLKRFLPTGLLVFGVILLVFAWTKKWDIYDYWRLKDYSPPAKVVQLADDTAMTSKARRLFYVYHPRLDNKSQLTKHCADAEATIVLGCYVGGQGIYISEITDKRLSGVLQVTAAHEVLHAAYDRLSGREKERINNLILKDYDKVSNPRIKENVEEYRKNGADVVNELHSILATEVHGLSAELEEYYKQYFKDRSKLVTYSENYDAAFTKRKKQVEDYDVRLGILKQQIETTQHSLSEKERNINSERSRLEALLNAGRVDEYNAGIANYNQLVNDYNSTVSTIRVLIDQYNELVRVRNELALEQNELYKAIDSRPSTISPH